MPGKTHPTYTRPTLSNTNGYFFRLVLDALQAAEEMGGPSGEDYLTLMRAVIAECETRIDAYKNVLEKQA